MDTEGEGVIDSSIASSLELSPLSSPIFSFSSAIEYINYDPQKTKMMTIGPTLSQEARITYKIMPFSSTLVPVMTKSIPYL
uniref:Uncharacterized protein n=1 Tax=Pristionchus pacificus TaxID=54126 RepID=A0A2A6BYH4_PRIPA|eukprot:PDM70909.1 hypothetical protein PRIPAC_44305 [Pristionchus pacificus]